MKQVVDQGDDSEFAHPTEAEQHTWQQNYFAQEQADPLQEEDSSEVQTKRLSVRITAGRTPYADFGVWGPCGKKVLRAMKFRTWTPSATLPTFDQYTVM